MALSAGSFDIWLRRERNRRNRLEASRVETLDRLFAWLDRRAAEFGVERALIFGSLIRPNGFGAASDVDLAVETTPTPGFASELELELRRDVDVVSLPQCRFAHKIEEEGLLWTPSPSAS